MHWHGRFKIVFARMVCLAVLAAALAPSVSQALRAGSAPAWAEICTAVVAQAARADGAGSPQPFPATPGEHLFEHCPYCSLHAGSLGLPPAPLSALPALPLVFGLAVAFLAAPRTLFAWLAAQPRAPPRAV